jgi:hypothetical protein
MVCGGFVEGWIWLNKQVHAQLFYPDVNTIIQVYWIHEGYNVWSISRHFMLQEICKKNWKYTWLNILANFDSILAQYFNLHGLPLVKIITFFEWNLSRGTRSRFCRWRRMFTRRWELPNPEFPADRSRSGVGVVTASVGATTTTTATATTACWCHARTPTHSRLQKQDRKTVL